MPVMKMMPDFARDAKERGVPEIDGAEVAALTLELEARAALATLRLHVQARAVERLRRQPRRRRRSWSLAAPFRFSSSVHGCRRGFRGAPRARRAGHLLVDLEHDLEGANEDVGGTSPTRSCRRPRSSSGTSR